MKQALIPVFILLVIVTLAIVATWPSSALEADHYQRFQDGKSLYAVLSGRIRRGDSLQEVEEQLGPAVPVEDMEAARTETQRNAAWNPDSFPDGVYDGDVFVAYPFENTILKLQFRNGTLVNHDPARFVEYQPHQDILGRDPSTAVAGRTAEKQQSETEP